MKEYEVLLINDDGSPMLQKDGSQFDDFSIKAESPKLAYEDFVKSIKPLPFAKISVHWGLLGSEQFEPPHFEGHQDPSKPNQNETKQANQATSVAVSSDNFESVLVKLDEINNNLAFFKRFIVPITISLFAILSWTALSATGSWWKWFAFFLAD